MRKAILYRHRLTADHTLGVLLTPGITFHTIERPWLDNRSNVSCIPLGEYVVYHLPLSASGRYSNVYHVQNVPGRSGILIHSGNTVNHSKGCLIIGLRAGQLAGQAAVLNSRTARDKLAQEMGTSPWRLEIRQ